MELFGLGPALLATFVGFGLMVGILFGFFGMGGSFLVTPALLVMGYRPSVAVGSGMAFVFGTAVIAAIKHHDLGQVDYRLGGLMIAGTAVGIELGRMGVYFLEAMGLASVVIGVTYVLLLGGIGVFVTRNALGEDDGAGTGGHDTDASVDPDDLPRLARTLQSHQLPPTLTIRGGVEVSLWTILAVALVTGVLSGFLGVGGGFIRMPAMFYALGVPVPVAVGTDLFEIVFSGGIGSYLYAIEGGVRLSIVAPLLAGSALGARVGSAATSIVDEGEIEIYFGLMLLGGSVAVVFQQLGDFFGVELLDQVGLALIFLSALLVSGAVIYSSVVALRADVDPAPSAAD